MTRVACQVLHRPNRLTFIWSEADALFEPYDLEGAEIEQFYQAARQAREQLAACMSDATKAADLAHAGRQLYRSIFKLDASGPSSAAEVHSWFRTRGQFTSFDMLSDAPGRIPWNALYDQDIDEQALRANDPYALRGFWGFRLPLGVGRRVNPLRVASVMQSPALLLAADTELLAGAPVSQCNLLNDLAMGRDAPVLTRAQDVRDRLRSSVPDIIYLFGRLERGGIVLGGEHITAAQLRDLFAQAPEGNPDPVVFLMACGDPAQWQHWECFVSASVQALRGAVLPEAPAGSDAVNVFGVQALAAFLQGKRLGQALTDTRQKDLVGLSFSAFCPAHVKVAPAGADANTGGVESDVPGPPPLPLPDDPYRPLNTFESEDRALFVGREDDITRCAALLDEPGTRALIVHGGPAVGKSSFLRAGVLPHLETEAVGYLVLRDRTPAPDDEGLVPGELDYPIVAIRPGKDLTGQLAEAISAFCAQPYNFVTPKNKKVTVNLPAILHAALHGESSTAIRPDLARTEQTTAITADVTLSVESPTALDATSKPPAPLSAPDALEVWRALLAAPDLFARLLDQLTRTLPFELVLVVDPGDDLVLLAHQEQDVERRRQALDMLAHSLAAPARYKLVLALRTEFVGRFLDALPFSRESWRPFFLPELGEDALTRVALAPTAREPLLYSDEVPHKKYAFDFEEGVAARLVKDVVKAADESLQSRIALLQAACSEAREFARTRNRSVFRSLDLKPKAVHVGWVLLGFAVAAAIAYWRGGLSNIPRFAGIFIGISIVYFIIYGLYYTSLPSGFGDLAGCMRRYLQRRLKPLRPATQHDVRRLLFELHTRTPEGCVVGRLVEAPKLGKAIAATSLPAALEGGAQVGVLEAQPLLVDGQALDFYGLPQDSLAQYASYEEAEQKKKAYATTKVADVLWVLVPLMFLVGAVIYWYMSQQSAAQTAVTGKRIEDMETALKLLREDSDALRWPFYLGALTRAEQALHSGNSVRARQILLTQQPMNAEKDLRGFEWRYLWKQAHQERLALYGHGNAVVSVAVAPDGKLAASASLDGTVRLWDLEKGRENAHLKGHKGGALAVAFAPDGKTVACGGADGIIRLWGAAAGGDKHAIVSKALKELGGHTGAVHALAFAKDGLFSAGKDKQVMRWNLDTGKEEETFKDHAEEVLALALSPDGKMLASGAADGHILIRTLGAKDEAKKLEGQGGVRTLAFSADGKTLAAGYQGGAIRTWSVSPDKSQKVEEAKVVGSHGADVWALAFDPSGGTLLSGGSDHLLREWDTKAGTMVRSYRGCYGAVAALAFSPDGKQLVSGSFDQTVKVWDGPSFRIPESFVPSKGPVQALAFSADGALLATAGATGDIQVWDATGSRGFAKPLATLPAGGSVRKLGTGSVKDKQVLFAHVELAKGEAVVKRWAWPAAADKASDLQDLPALGKGALTVVAVSADGKWLATAAPDKTVTLLDVAGGETKHTLEGHKGVISSLAFTVDGRYLLSGDDQGMMHTWNVLLGSVDRRGALKVGAPITALASYFGTPGFVTAGLDRSLDFWIWNPDDEKPNRDSSHRSHGQPVTALAVGPDFLVTASHDSTLKLFDLQREDNRFTLQLGKERFTFVGHTGPIQAVAVSPNGLMIASAGQDGTVRFWRATRPAPSRVVEEP